MGTPSRPGQTKDPGITPGSAQAPQTPLLSFFLLAYAGMWPCFSAIAFGRIPEGSPLRAGLVLLGVFSPALAAVWLTARAEGRDGVRRLLSRVIDMRVALKWYLFALLYMAALKIVVALIARLIYGEWPRFGTLPLYLIPLAILVSTPVQAGEEIGWRGYALPRLAERYGLLRGTLLLGVIWALWHLPQFFITDEDTFGQSFFVWALQVVPLSVAIAWVYFQTKGSLFLTMLMHASINNSKDIVPAAIQGASNTFTLHASRVSWISLAVLWAAAAYFLLRMPPAGTWRRS